MRTLRPYQATMVNRVKKTFQQGDRRIIVQLPPRTGKTVVMAEMAKQATDNGRRVMFLIHRKEVLDQARQTFRDQGVDMSLTTMGMVQTITRRIDRLSPPDLIFIDEAHHAIAQSYRRILDAFPRAFVLLFTATPIRTGRQQLDQIADRILVGPSIEELTRQGMLAPFDYYGLTDLDRQKLKKSHGDYTVKSMDEAVDKRIYGSIVKQYRAHANRKQAVVYAYSVENAKLVADAFNRAGINAAEVDGETDAGVRNAIVQRFRDQDLTILVNVNLFTEGVDLPNVDCVIMARPTNSLALFLQFSMRCLNPRENKRAIIIDHVGNFLNFGLPNEDRDWQAAIVTKAKKSRSPAAPTNPITQCDHCFAVFYRTQIGSDRRCPQCHEPLKVDNTDRSVVDVDLRKITAADLAVKKRRELAERMLGNAVLENVADKALSELSTYNEFQAYAKLHGFKPGWAYYQWKGRRKWNSPKTNP